MSTIFKLKNTKKFRDLCQSLPNFNRDFQACCFVQWNNENSFIEVKEYDDNFGDVIWFIIFNKNEIEIFCN